MQLDKHDQEYETVFVGTVGTPDDSLVALVALVALVT